MAAERPPVWIGHVTLAVTDLERAAAFWSGLGLRPVERNPHVAVLELRGGTHLVLLPADERPSDDSAVPFDLMVEDLDAVHAQWRARDLAVSEIVRGHIHDSFTVTDPDGWVVMVNSTHVVGTV